MFVELSNPSSGGGYLSYFLITVTTILTLFHLWWSQQRWVIMGKKIPSVPGIWTLPIVGNAHYAWRNPTQAMEAMLQYTKGCTLSRGFLGPKLYVAVADPRDIEVVMGGHVNLEKASEYDLFKPWLGDGLLISSGNRWKSHRKMIAPTFHASILKTFIPVFNKNSQNVVQKLRKLVGQTVDVHDYMSETTVDILLETAMGVTKEDKDVNGFEYAKAVMDMCNILHLRHYKFWLRPDFIFKWTSMATAQEKFLNIIHTLTNQVIKKKKENFFERNRSGKKETLYTKAVQEEMNMENNNADKDEAKEAYVPSADIRYIRDDLDENDENDIGEKKRLAFLDYMIEASHMDQNVLSDHDIKEEVDTIMFEGHDTTAAASSFFLCVMGCHPEIQEKVYEELETIFHGSKRPITFSDTLEMKYLERCLLETLRLYPPVPIIARKCEKDVKLASGDYTIPKGITVVIVPYQTHRIAEYYPNPEVFNPDNFLPEKCAARHYYSFIPFSAGPRSCVGRKYAMLKLKVLLADLIRNFKIHSEPEKTWKMQGDIILKRSDGFNITLENRQ